MQAGMRKYMKVCRTMISINNPGQEKSDSRHGRKFYRIIPIIIALALFGAMSDTYAQQKDSLVRVLGIPISLKAEAKTEDKKDDKKKDDPPPLTERERTLLDRIEQLERRLAEVESRMADKASKSSGENSQPAGATTTNTSQPAEAPALNTTAAVPKAGASETTQSPAEPGDVGISPKFGPGSASQERAKETKEPFAFADFTWLTGNPRTKKAVIDTEYFTGEFRADVAYHHDFNHPKDNTISGSSEVFRSGEVNLTQLGIGGDFHYNNVRGRLL